MSFRDLMRDASVRAGGGERVAKQADFPVRNSGQPLAKRDAQTEQLLPRFNAAAERRQAKEAGFSPLLRALARHTATVRRRELETGADEHTRAVRTERRPGHTSRAYEVRGNPPPEREKMSDQVAHLAKRSSTTLDDDLPEGWVAAYPKGTHPSRGSSGFWAGREDWIRRERGR